MGMDPDHKAAVRSTESTTDKAGGNTQRKHHGHGATAPRAG